MTVCPGSGINLTTLITTNASSRSSLVVTEAHRATLHNQHKGQLSVKVLSEIFSVSIRGMIFPRYHVLFDPFNEKLKQLYEAGIIQNWIEELNKIKYKPPEDGPAVLTVDHVTVGFQVCCCCLLIAAVAFILELAIFHRRNIYEISLSGFKFLIFKPLIRSYISSLSFNR